jgi:hypothetical protein
VYIRTSVVLTLKYPDFPTAPETIFRYLSSTIAVSFSGMFLLYVLCLVK